MPALMPRVTDGALAYVLELERRDAALAASLETLGSLRARTRAGGAEAARLAAVLDRSLGGVSEWSSRADGALLLARSGLDGERDAVVREANELAESLMGEPPVPGGVRRIREQVEARGVG